MYIRWFIGLVLQCLSLVAQGRAYTYEAINEQSGACIECSLKLKISQVTFDLGKYTNLKKAYTGFQSQLGSGYTTFENALKKCNNDVLTAFDNNTALFNKLGNIKDLGETELAERMAKVSKGEDYGVLKVGNNLVGLQGAGNITNVFFKNVDEFASTFDKAGTVSQTIRNQAFDLYKQGKWGELETLFKNNNLNEGWPPANGGFNIDKIYIKKGEKFDRYQYKINIDEEGNLIYSGGYVSPIISNNNFFSYTSRALKGEENNYDIYYEILVKKDFDFQVEKATIIPWWGHEGYGIQIALPEDRGIDWLLKNKYIEISPMKSPNGKINLK